MYVCCNVQKNTNLSLFELPIEMEELLRLDPDPASQCPVRRIKQSRPNTNDKKKLSFRLWLHRCETFKTIAFGPIVAPITVDCATFQPSKDGFDSCLLLHIKLPSKFNHYS